MQDVGLRLGFPALGECLSMGQCFTGWENPLTIAVGIHLADPY